MARTINGITHRDYQECLKRYPRLARCIQWQAILSWGEAGSGLRDWRSRSLYGLTGDQVWGCEAIAHYGGMQKLLAAAIKNRHIIRRCEEGRRFHRCPW